MKQQAIILMGSKSDLPMAKEIAEELNNFSIDYKMHVASAHRTPQRVIELDKKYSSEEKQILYIAIAGLSNALSGMLAAISPLPILSCPPYKIEDLFSSLRMPSGVSHATVLKPKNVALMAAKIFSLNNSSLKEKVQNFLKTQSEKVIKDDLSLNQNES